MVLEVLNWLFIAVQVFVFFVGLYFFIISLCSLIPKKEKKKNHKFHSFAIMIPAHNEEAVIAPLVECLKTLNYPKDKYEIFVIADNCSDDTASMAENAGATVLRRFDNEKTGKGYTLEWGFNQIFDKDYDYVAIFDADNLVGEDFLLEMNTMAGCGHKVVQGFIESKNPYDTPMTAACTYAFWTVNLCFQKPHYNLGLSAQISGTGFIVETNLLNQLGWGSACLTEDTDFTMKLVLNNEKVAWCQKAVVYDEKPLDLKSSWYQRKRWIQGHSDVYDRYFKKLIFKSIKTFNLAIFDCAIYLLQPMRMVCSGIIMILCLLQNLNPGGEFGIVNFAYLFRSPLVWNLFTCAQLVYPLILVLMYKKRFSFKLLYAYICGYIYEITWFPIGIAGIKDKKKTIWYHTKHTQKITIEEVIKS